MLTRRLLAGAVVAAALVPFAPPASAGEMCRIVIDPRQVWTPVGYVQVPMVYCVRP